MKKLNMNNQLVKENLEKLVNQYNELLTSYDFASGELATTEDKLETMDLFKYFQKTISRLEEQTQKSFNEIIKNKLNINYFNKISFSQLSEIENFLVELFIQETNKKIAENPEKEEEILKRYSETCILPEGRLYCSVKLSDLIAKQLANLVYNQEETSIPSYKLGKLEVREIQLDTVYTLKFLNEVYKNVIYLGGIPAYLDNATLNNTANSKYVKFIVNEETLNLELVNVYPDTLEEELDYLTDLIHTTEYNSEEFKNALTKINNIKEILEEKLNPIDEEIFNELLTEDFFNKNLNLIKSKGFKFAVEIDNQFLLFPDTEVLKDWIISEHEFEYSVINLVDENDFTLTRNYDFITLNSSKSEITFNKDTNQYFYIHVDYFHEEEYTLEELKELLSNITTELYKLFIKL